MTLPHDRATAKITIDGLAVCCYNRQGNKWEVGYLRHPNRPPHYLILQIENETGIDIPDTIREITITATSPQPVPGTPDGFFDPIRRRPNRNTFPTTADELENFRWVVDLQDPTDTGHGNANPQRALFPITRAFIHNAVFYTSELTSKAVFRTRHTNHPQDDPNNMDQNTLEQHLFGRTNHEIGADIFCAPANGAVTITIPGVLPQPRVLQHRPGQPWNIRLTNLCYRPGGTGLPRFEIGDFHLFYDVLTVSGQKQSIWGELVNDPIFIDTGRVDCDTTWMGASETLDLIMPTP